ncbi:MAG: hypothetical protein QF926_08340 [Alphaproteobacteria bacterium]|nr:hypothetical protein [Alphaproteobacteria bacterium]MDP6516614.1 hypothetical protein [Alphaproteobacteria bacterium]
MAGGFSDLNFVGAFGDAGAAVVVMDVLWGASKDSMARVDDLRFRVQ